MGLASAWLRLPLFQESKSVPAQAQSCSKCSGSLHSLVLLSLLLVCSPSPCTSNRLSGLCRFYTPHDHGAPNSITLSPHSLPLTLWNFLLKTQVRSWLLCNPGLLLTLSDMLLRCARAGSWLPGASCPNSWKLSLCQLCMGSGSVRM